MTTIQLILIGLAIIGFLPLLIIIYKRRLVKRILTTGALAKAEVYSIRLAHKSSVDIVWYRFVPTNARVYCTGSLTTKIGRYKQGDLLDVYYLPENPKRNTVEGAWKSAGFLWFGILIAAFILFAVYKINQEVAAGHM
ncbi:DUF3592 domain-containing protein [Flavihumibacter sp. UBA7668]|uniref:DUF3592 domain-containing protein n=1 Tax=Flavihumibacter sp. UBA7668 TaxID=1946542 RepID=UPI0025BAF1CA|nr:DUF3592 domain-containing protein [Flavihumibacter sp. UBA7668]